MMLYYLWIKTDDQEGYYPLDADDQLTKKPEQSFGFHEVFDIVDTMVEQHGFKVSQFKVVEVRE